MDAAFYTRNDRSPDETRRADAAYGELAQAVRELNEAQLRTEIGYDDALSIAAQLREVTARLLQTARPGALGVEIDADGHARNHGNTVVGLRNPFAMAVGDHKIHWNDNGATARLVLGPLCEGPPGHVHGGVLALVLDQLLGEAAAAAQGPGMTGRLTLSYRRPTPLGEVSMEAWLDRVEGVKTYMKGRLMDAAGEVTVEAEGLFILPKWAREAAGEWPRRPPTFE